ncbi:hypothetical protein PAHAL_3G423300 [Panicum hallii]|jgi:hypothetical protein|uniref:Uncharacterized protein n=1 Tax=Panicum hallii TaxID=206008 RepID=A0A2T8KL19_9POAL|nr:hypothetical protein PAHAL_3G423300 [Panicum hallii]
MPLEVLAPPCVVPVRTLFSAGVSDEVTAGTQAAMATMMTSIATMVLFGAIVVF